MYLGSTSSDTLVDEQDAPSAPRDTLDTPHVGFATVRHESLIGMLLVAWYDVG